jgi:hypothetical protein
MNLSAAARAGVTALMIAALAVPFAAQDPCGATIWTMPSRFFRPGGSGTVQVLAPAGCTWSLSLTDTWVTFTSPPNGTGNGSVQFDVEPLASGERLLQVMLTGASPRNINQSATVQSPALVESPSGQEPTFPDPALIDVRTSYPPFDLHGWVIDPSVSIGTGYDAVRVTRFITPLIFEFVGQATYGEARPHVEAFLGTQFGASGYSLRIPTLPAGMASLRVEARHTTTGTYQRANDHSRDC